MAVHLEAKVGQFFTHQASESLLCSAHERCTVLSSARGATLKYQGIIQKSVNLWYIKLGCLDDGANESSTKRLMSQLLLFFFFFRLFIDLEYSKLFNFIFVILQKNNKMNWKALCKIFCKKWWKKNNTWTSDAWLTICLSHRPSDPAYYIVN